MKCKLQYISQCNHTIVYNIVYKITQVQDTHIINVVHEIEIHRYIIYIDYY